MIRFALLFALAPLALSAQEAGERLLSIGGSVTEIVYALGAQERLVGRDTTSSFPPEAEALPDVGYMRALSPEGVLSVAPDKIIAEAGSGPAEVIDVLKSSGVEYVEIPDGFDRAGIRAKINAVGAALALSAEAAVLADEVDAELAAAEAAAQERPEKGVMFILSTQGGRLMVSGTGTAADGVIRLAGGRNVIDSFEGYKPVSAEAVSAANPDVILMMARGDHSADDAALWSMPSLITTQAARDKAVVRMDGLLLLGFGPRTPEAVTRLSAALHGG